MDRDFLGSLICKALSFLTLRLLGHRWMVVSHEPLRRFCRRCKLEEPEGATDWKNWR